MNLDIQTLSTRVRQGSETRNQIQKVHCERNRHLSTVQRIEIAIQEANRTRESRRGDVFVEGPRTKLLRARIVLKAALIVQKTSIVRSVLTSQYLPAPTQTDTLIGKGCSWGRIALKTALIFQRMMIGQYLAACHYLPSRRAHYTRGHRLRLEMTTDNWIQGTHWILICSGETTCHQRY
jgi:hypothetical protein